MCNKARLLELIRNFNSGSFKCCAVHRVPTRRVYLPPYALLGGNATVKGPLVLVCASFHDARRLFVRTYVEKKPYRPRWGFFVNTTTLPLSETKPGGRWFSTTMTCTSARSPRRYL